MWQVFWARGRIYREPRAITCKREVKCWLIGRLCVRMRDSEGSCGNGWGLVPRVDGKRTRACVEERICAWMRVRVSLCDRLLDPAVIAVLSYFCVGAGRVNIRREDERKKYLNDTSAFCHCIFGIVSRCACLSESLSFVKTLLLTHQNGLL